MSRETPAGAARRWLACCLAATSFVVSQPTAFAATPEASARADQLFGEGLARMNADDCEGAIPRFLESQRLDPTAAALTNIATCLERLGKTASAFNTYRQAADVATLDGEADLGAQARAAAAKLAPALTRLWIVTTPGTVTITVRVNGETADHRNPIPVDPGPITVEVSAPGRTPWSTTVDATTPGVTIDVTVPDLQLERSMQDERSVQDEPSVQDTTQARRPNLRPAAIAVAGAGLAGLVVGAVYAVNAEAAHEDSAAYCDPTGKHCTQPGVDLQDKAWERAAVATGATVFGVAAIAAGAGIWVFSPAQAERGRIRVGPFVARERGARQPAALGLSVVGEL